MFKDGKTLWVPVIGTGAATDPFRPDVPEGIDVLVGIPVGPDGRPTVAHCEATVHARDVARCRKAVSADAVSDADKVKHLEAKIANLAARKEK